MSFKAFSGVMVAFAGAAIIIGKPWEVAVNGDKVLLGNILFVTSMLAGVISAVIAKPVLKKMSSFQAAFMYVFPGTLTIIPFTIMELGNWSFKGLPSSAYFSLVYSISAVTIANLLFMYGLKYKKVHSVGIFQYLQPIAIFITAWFLLDERPTIRYAAGAFLVVLGIYLGDFHLPSIPKLKRKHYLRRWQIKFLQNGL
jgi:drug/metabolite transporter (DMT)-like permease